MLITQSASSYYIQDNINKVIKVQFEERITEAVKNSDTFKDYIKTAIDDIDKYNIMFNVNIHITPKKDNQNG